MKKGVRGVVREGRGSGSCPPDHLNATVGCGEVKEGVGMGILFKVCFQIER